MKLHRLNQISETTHINVCRRIFILENILGDLASVGATKLRTKVANSLSNLDDTPQIKQLRDRAKSLEVSLLKSSPEATKWWAALFDHFTVPGSERQDLLFDIVRRARSQVDLTREETGEKKGLRDFRRRLENGEVSDQEAQDAINNILQRRGGQQTESTINKALDRVEILENAITEAWQDKGKEVLANMLDMLDAKTLNNKRASIVRSANNERIAATAIQSMAQWAQKAMDKATEEGDNSRVKQLMDVLGIVEAEVVDEPEVVEPEEPEVVEPEDPEQPDEINQTDQGDIDPKTGQNKEDLASNIAIQLWKWRTMRETGVMRRPISGASDRANWLSFGPEDAKSLLDDIKKLGYKVVWQGAKKSGYPLGDKPPKVTKV